MLKEDNVPSTLAIPGDFHTVSWGEWGRFPGRHQGREGWRGMGDSEGVASQGSPRLLCLAFHGLLNPERRLTYLNWGGDACRRLPPSLYPGEEGIPSPTSFLWSHCHLSLLSSPGPGSSGAQENSVHSAAVFCDSADLLPSLRPSSLPEG